VRFRYTRVPSMTCIKNDSTNPTRRLYLHFTRSAGFCSEAAWHIDLFEICQNSQTPSLAVCGNWLSTTRIVCSFAAHSRQSRCLHSAGTSALPGLKTRCRTHVCRFPLSNYGYHCRLCQILASCLALNPLDGETRSRV
jgi:hypothetical protein